MSSYFLRNNACKKCPQSAEKDAPCLECIDETQCIQCREGYVLRSFKDLSMSDSTKTENRCVACPTEDGCLDCSENKCKTCKPGYFMLDN